MRARRSPLFQFVFVLACLGSYGTASANPVADANRLIPALATTPIKAPTRLGSADTDQDGVVDVEDNCLTVQNPAQTDSNGDGIGNACDADLNQDCVVNVVDLGILRSVFFSTDPDADLNGDGIVNVVDLGLMRSAFFDTPGPSAVANSCGVNLTINGRVRGATLPGAIISARITGADYLTTYIFNTTLQPDGTYSLTLFAPTRDDFITLRAAGTVAADQGFIWLESDAGTAGRLDDAGLNSGAVSHTQLSALDISALTSAAATLAREENGGAIQSDAQLDRALAQADSALMTDLAVLIKLYIDVDGLMPPTGATNTMALIGDQIVRLPLFDLLVVALNSLTEDFADDQTRILTVPYTATDVPATLNLFTTENIQALEAQIIELRPDNTVRFTALDDDGTGTWTLAAGGTVQIDFAPDIVTDDRVIFIEDPANPGSFIEVRQVTAIDTVSLRRVINGVEADHVHSSNTLRVTYPENPQVPSTVTIERLGRQTAFVGFEQSRPFPLSPADLADQNYVAAFYHRDNNSEGSIEPRLGADTLEFNTDGSGQTRRRGFGFSWTVSPGDGLEIVFDNGDINRFAYFGDEDDNQLVTVVDATMVNAGRAATRTRLFEPACTSNCGQAAFTDARWRSDLVTRATIRRSFSIFDFELNSDGTACRNPGSTNNQWTWAFNDGRVEFVRDFNSDPDFFFYRTWEPVFETPAGFYVIETLQIANNTPQVDAAVTPGRLNFYSREQDLINNQRAVLMPDAATVPSDVGVNFYFDLLTLNDIDPEGDQVIVRDADLVSANGGTLTRLINPLSSQWVGVQYTPPPGFVGVDTFEYRASDLVCVDDPVTSATVSITLLPN
ncbi:MAG: Ig-like domain-containing protein [Gammaproteobacteria bacterium]